MKIIEAERLFRTLEPKKNAYRTYEIGLLLNEQGETLRSSIKRLLKAKIIERVARDVYWHLPTCAIGCQPLDEIAVMIRATEINFIGMDSAASQWGVISQIPVGRLTVMTTGREGEFNTRFGTIEFIHTKAAPTEIYRNTVPLQTSPLRIASKRYAVQGLLRAKRSLDLIDWEELEDE